MNISDTFFSTSSIETPKLQRPPETSVPSTEKTLLLKEQTKNGLRASSKTILTGVTLDARGGIWWDMEGIIHYEMLERYLTVTAERYNQQTHRLEETIQPTRPGRRLTTLCAFTACYRDSFTFFTFTEQAHQP
jgi:hypothetical protein